MRPKSIKTKKGEISAYGFACGSCLIFTMPTKGSVNLFQESGCYHVQYIPIIGKLIWKTFSIGELGKARKQFVEFKKQLLK